MKFTKTLEEDINSQVNAGFTRQEIKQNLLMKGISEEEINNSFETTNFEQVAASRNNGVSYKSIIITIIFLLISTFKVIRCISKMDGNDRTAFEQNDINLHVSNHHEQTNKILAAQGEKIIYKDYAELSISEIPLENFKILKLKNDTSISFSLSTKLRIEKNTFYFNNHDERLRMALKEEDNINIFIYDFEGKDSLLEEFKTSKSIGKYEYLSSEKTKSLTTINYNYVVDNISYNGCALAFKEGQNYLYFAFESNDKTHKQLKAAGLFFITQKLVRI
ncbi:MAG: hypothetical protein EOP00_10000 [Pedobacter sp.]|nr:MAG: hypothetical protein EOP00_10000 [Pedobacter sp.]